MKSMNDEMRKCVNCHKMISDHSILLWCSNGKRYFFVCVFFGGNNLLFFLSFCLQKYQFSNTLLRFFLSVARLYTWTIASSHPIRVFLFVECKQNNNIDNSGGGSSSSLTKQMSRTWINAIKKVPYNNRRLLFSNRFELLIK